MTDYSEMPPRNPPERTLAEQRELYLAHLGREREAINVRYGQALEGLNRIEKLYEDWYAQQI